MAQMKYHSTHGVCLTVAHHFVSLEELLVYIADCHHLLIDIKKRILT